MAQPPEAKKPKLAQYEAEDHTANALDEDQREDTDNDHVIDDDDDIDDDDNDDNDGDDHDRDYEDYSSDDIGVDDDSDEDNVDDIGNNDDEDEGQPRVIDKEPEIEEENRVLVEDPINEGEEEEEADVITDEEREEEEGAHRPLFQGIGQNQLMNVPLVNNNALKAIDHLLVVLARAVRHNSTYSRIIDELKWMKSSFQHINIPTTKAALWNVLGRDTSNLVYRLYCSRCRDKVGKAPKVIKTCVCGECGPGLSESNLATFIQARLIPQLRDLLKFPNITESLRYKNIRVKINPEAMEDIYDGEKYKELSIPGKFLSHPYNFSFTLWTDGVTLAKSSKATCYPIFLHLNELPPHARKRNPIFAGIWVANDSPELSTLLLPIVNELRSLHDTGIVWSPDGGAEVRSKFITSIFTADSVTRHNALRMKQYNGSNGCTFCTAPGEVVEGRRVYPAQPFASRTDVSIRDDALCAFETGTPVNGVKGLSPLALLPKFNLVDGVVVNSCHNQFLGVAKQLFTMMRTNVGKPWYIGHPQNLRTIDQRLLRIKTPSRIYRRPRSIAIYKKWKASEWRNWLLYYALPCLDGILPRCYLIHWAKLAEAIYIFNNASITENDINAAGTLLKDFIRDFEQYGSKNMSFNVHLLGHIEQSVRNWGPLWGYTTSPFESLNQKILAATTSPYRRADQIVTRFFLSKFIATHEVNIAPRTQNEIQRLLRTSRLHVPHGMVEGHYIVGQGKALMRNPLDDEIRLIEAAGFPINGEVILSVFKKAVIHGAEYQVDDRDGRKFSNCMVYSRTGFWIISKILSFGNEENKVCGFIGKRLQERGSAHGVTYMRHIVPSRETAFIPYGDVVAPGFRMQGPGNACAVALANCWETD